jgi:AraC-like DNA-binding protein
MTTQARSQTSPFGNLKGKGFKVHEITRPVDLAYAHVRRDFYKIVLLTGHLTIGYGHQTIDMNGSFLFFANPHVPHSVVHHSKANKGYSCVFTEAFMAGRERSEMLKNSPLFMVEATPVVPVNSEQAAYLAGLFQKMLAVNNADYTYKHELCKSCIELLIHEALRIQPIQNAGQQKNAASRMSHLFLDLLERQFPIESVKYPLQLRTAQDFAQALSVHVNYLNRSVKEVTGKSTSVLIAERIATEAKALLQHSDWSVADIAYGLGFEYPTYFNNYFKRVTGATPKSFRKDQV